MSKATIGVLMIVKNESKHLASCLETVKEWVDEIVILDSGSSDDTETIARQFTDKFYTNTDWQGFGKQRQLAQSYLTTDWVLPLDADERVSDELKASILDVLKQNPHKTVYTLNRLSHALGKFIRHSGWYPDTIVRLYRRNEVQYNSALVHESVEVPNDFTRKHLNGDLLHYTFDSLSQYTNKTALYMKSWADQREGKKKVGITSAILHGFFRFFKMYILKRGFLDGRHGLLLAILSANTTFTRYADLWIRDYTKQKSDKQS
ncbi:glycosyltransferase [Vibrio caribbeanicus]|uniref:Glycosyltransferase n=1 Tax=Vibrio caribbeanicus TaxID=701175 RepID=A0ACC4NSG3_9VIBR|nr:MULTISPECIES: glycosyltransferase family 2 protein [Vibrio]KHD23452.1 glycosyltransferase [Vibrio caribbeanicus]KIE19477.1 glycosyltransferase [Vibrio sinaloensis]